MRAPHTVCCFALVLCLAGVASGEKAAGASAKCGEEKAKLKELESQVSSLREQLATARAEAQSAKESEFSVLNMAMQAGEMTQEVISHLLEQTDIDDQVVDMVSKQAGAASTLTSSLADQITSMDYQEQAKSLASHPVYLNYVAPHMQTLAVNTQPLVDQYLSPAIAGATGYISPAFDSVQKDVLPILTKSSSQVFEQVSEAPQHVSSLKMKLQQILDPVFSFGAKAAPKHRGVLPKNPVDRLLFLALFLFIAYKLLRLSMKAGWLTLKVGTGSTKVIVKITIKTPLRILGYALWISTCFACCGLCLRRKAKAAKGAPNGKAVSVAEFEKILEASKKKGKLQQGANQLAKLVGKPMTAPKDVEGKIVTKDSLMQALKKFRDIDLKKLPDCLTSM